MSAPVRWPYHRPGSALSFPRDEGWHSLLPGGVANPSFKYMEWVYLNAHVREVGGAGREFTVFSAFFTQNFRLASVRAFDAAGRFLGAHHATSWGLLRGRTERLDLSFRHRHGTDRWTTAAGADGEPLPFATRLSVTDEGLGIDLDLSTARPPYEAGGVGYLPFGSRGAFSYYSLTRLEVQGTLTLPDSGGAEKVAVRGIGWFDHQWGPFYVTPFRNKFFEEYEWMSIQLDSGDDLILTTVWEPSGETPSLPAYGGVGLVRADGRWDKLVGAHRWRRTRFWHCPAQNAYYAAGWELEAPEWDLKLRILPKHHDQMVPVVGPPPRKLIGRAASHFVDGLLRYLGGFWEGTCLVDGHFGARAVRGVAFAELVKRYQNPKIAITLEKSDAGVTVAHWQVKNPDEQVPLTHRFYVEDGRGAVLAQRSGLDLPIAVLDDPALPRNAPLWLRVISHSCDGTLSCTASKSFQLE